MNDFDLFLELQLRHMLDNVVGAPPPARRRHKRSSQPDSTPLLVVEPARLELAMEAIPVVEPVVTLPIAPLRGV